MLNTAYNNDGACVSLMDGCFGSTAAAQYMDDPMREASDDNAGRRGEVRWVALFVSPP